MHRQTSKADISVSMNRAGNQLEELMDKIDECEKEMLRMNQDHNKEIMILSSEIEDLNKKIDFAAVEKAENASTIARLKQALKESDEELRRLQQSKVRQEIDKAEKNTKISGKHIINNNKNDAIIALAGKSTFQRQLRPRKPLGTSTNQPSM